MSAQGGQTRLGQARLGQARLGQSRRDSLADSSGADSSGTDSSGSERGDSRNRVSVRFEDNRLATLLFGRLDEHLALIERSLGVQCAARGNLVSISGAKESVERSCGVLKRLYSRLESGGSVERGDVEGAIRMSEKGIERDSTPPARISTRKKAITARTPVQDEYVRAMQEKELVFATGAAGTGKTYLAVAMAASLLESGTVERIALSRPAVEAGERLGFLPGDVREKVDPYLRPLYDALYDVMGGSRIERALSSGVIEIAPLAFMRGRTLSNAAVLLDEAQNATEMQMKMFLTRLGENSRMIVTGDPSQVDLPAGQRSGLVEALGILRGIEGIAMISFGAGDVVRHGLVSEIVEAYDKAAGAKASASRDSSAPKIAPTPSASALNPTPSPSEESRD